MTKSVDPTPDKSTSQIALGVVLLFTLIVRTAAVVSLFDNLQQDTDAYRVLAETIDQFGIFGFGNQEIRPPRPTAFRPPLYPLLLSVLVIDGQLSLVAVAILHIALGLGTVAIVWSIGKYWGLGHCSFVAAVLVACDPLLVYQSAELMTETIAAFFAAAGLWALTAARARRGFIATVAAGGVLGLASLTRPTFLPWVALVICLELFESARQKKVRRAVCLAVGASLALAPWGLRNAREFGQFKLTTTHGGYTLLLGNNPDFYDHLRRGDAAVWDSRRLDAAWLRRSSLRDASDDLLTGGPADRRIDRNEFEEDQLAYQFAKRYIREDFQMFLVACGYRIVSLWQVLPNQLDPNESTLRRVARYGTAAWYAAVFIACLVGTVRLRWRLLAYPWIWGLLLCVVFTGVHTLYWSNMRMRAPLMPFLALLAAAAFCPSHRHEDVDPRPIESAQSA